MIYYGDEVGLFGKNDPDCRRSMAWIESDWDQEIYHYYKKLIEIRGAHTWLSRAEVKVQKVFNGLIVMWLESGDNRLLLVANSQGEAQHQVIELKGIKPASVMELITQKTYNIEENLTLDKIEETSILLFKV
jgi:glycosidase